MNWNKLFEYIETKISLAEIETVIENNETFSSSILRSDKNYAHINFISDISKINEYDILYYESKEMFAVWFDEDEVAIAKSYLISFLKAYKAKKEYLKSDTNNVTFFDHEFMLHMHMASDVSSGFTHFRKSVNEIAKSLKNGVAKFDGGMIIKTEKELNAYLIKKIHGFENLFKSVDEIKNSGDVFREEYNPFS